MIAAKDVVSQSGETYWEKLKSPFALAAYAADPEFHSEKPWTRPKVMASWLEVSRMMLSATFSGEILEQKHREAVIGFQTYIGQQDVFAASSVFPRRNEDGIVDELFPMMAYKFWQTYGAVCGPAQEVCVKLCAQVCSATSAERDYKAYKNVVTKKRSGLGRTRGDGVPTAPMLLNVHANLHVAEIHETDNSAQERALRSFNISDEVEWAQTFRTGGLDTRALSPFKNYVEDWEDINAKDDATRFKLQDKYVGMKLKDVEPGVYLEWREVVSIVWVNRQGWHVCSKQVDETGAGEACEDTNQSYVINTTLHDLIAMGNNPNRTMVPDPCADSESGATATAPTAPSNATTTTARKRTVTQTAARKRTAPAPARRKPAAKKKTKTGRALPPRRKVGDLPAGCTEDDDNEEDEDEDGDASIA